MSGYVKSKTGELGVVENVGIAVGILLIAHPVSDMQSTSGFVSVM